MKPSAPYLHAVQAKLALLENRVWSRNQEEGAQPDRCGEMLAYLMTDRERQQWRSLNMVVAELREM